MAKDKNILIDKHFLFVSGVENDLIAATDYEKKVIVEAIKEDIYNLERLINYYGEPEIRSEGTSVD